MNGLKDMRNASNSLRCFSPPPHSSVTIKGKDFIVYCDASHSRLGVVLMWDRNFIAYVSRDLMMHEKNYTTHDLMLAAAVFALKIWQH